MVWYKEGSCCKKKVSISSLTFYKRMIDFQRKWVQWLFKCPECALWWGLLFNLETQLDGDEKVENQCIGLGRAVRNLRVVWHLKIWFKHRTHHVPNLPLTSNILCAKLISIWLDVWARPDRSIRFLLDLPFWKALSLRRNRK